MEKRNFPDWLPVITILAESGTSWVSNFLDWLFDKPTPFPFMAVLFGGSFLLGLVVSVLPPLVLAGIFGLILAYGVWVTIEYYLNSSGPRQGAPVAKDHHNKCSHLSVGGDYGK